MTRAKRTSVAELRRGEAAAWGPQPMRPDQQPTMRLVRFDERRQGALRGFAEVELPIGLILHDVPVFAGATGPWAVLPTKPQLDRDRRQKLGADGKPLFTAVVEWRNRDLAARFSAGVVELIRADYPGALE
jgi:hypothetical protein